MIQFYLLLAVACVCSLGGEIFCKMGSQALGQMKPMYLGMAMVFWASSAIVWTQIYSKKSITEVIAIYNPVQLLLLASIGIMKFGEPITPKLILSYILLLICFWLMK